MKNSGIFDKKTTDHELNTSEFNNSWRRDLCFGKIGRNNNIVCEVVTFFFFLVMKNRIYKLDLKLIVQAASEREVHIS